MPISKGKQSDRIRRGFSNFSNCSQPDSLPVSLPDLNISCCTHGFDITLSLLVFDVTAISDKLVRLSLGCSVEGRKTLPPLLCLPYAMRVNRPDWIGPPFSRYSGRQSAFHSFVTWNS